MVQAHRYQFPPNPRPLAVALHLTPAEREMLQGAAGETAAPAMRVVVAAADLLGAEQPVEISSAHVDGCLYHADGGVEFAEKLVAGGGRVAVPVDEAHAIPALGAVVAGELGYAVVPSCRLPPSLPSPGWTVPESGWPPTASSKQLRTGVK